MIPGLGNLNNLTPKQLLALAVSYGVDPRMFNLGGGVNAMMPGAAPGVAPGALPGAAAALNGVPHGFDAGTGEAANAVLNPSAYSILQQNDPGAFAPETLGGGLANDIPQAATRAAADMAAQRGSAGRSASGAPRTYSREELQTLEIKDFGSGRSRFFLKHKSKKGGYIVQRVNVFGTIYFVGKDNVAKNFEKKKIPTFWEAFPVAPNTYNSVHEDTWTTLRGPGTHGNLTTSVSATFYEGLTDSELLEAGMSRRGTPGAVPEARDSPFSSRTRPRIKRPPTADAFKRATVRF